MSKILIVDDDEQATELLERFVAMYGHEATTVNRSSLAVELANAFNPDLIMVDLMMPGLNGFEVCALLRAESKTANTPIIVLSALEDGESKTKAIKAGATEYICKPFNLINLTERIDELTGKK
jgi:DNA-binding response OmpR family regulator